MTLFKADGGKIDHAPTDVKKEHDSAELTRERIRMMNILENAYKAFVDEYNEHMKQQGPVQLNVPALRKKHGEPFAEMARAMNASSFPHPIDENALYEVIDNALNEEQRKKDLSTPLGQLTKLDKYDFLPIGNTTNGLLYINTHVAVCISPVGMVQLWLRGRYETVDTWCSGWLPKPERAVILESMDYRLGEVHNLLASLQVQMTARLNEAQMDACRKPTPMAKRRWWPF